MNTKLLFKLDVPRRWKYIKYQGKKHDCNFMGTIMLLQQNCKTNVANIKRTRYPPPSSS
jgi:hypothetical protein